MYEVEVRTVLDLMPVLSSEQIMACNSVVIPAEEHGLAIGLVGDEIDALMASLPDGLDGGVYAVGRAAILGLLIAEANPVEGRELAAGWESAVGAFDWLPQSTGGDNPGETEATTSSFDENTALLAAVHSGEVEVPLPEMDAEETILSGGLASESGTAEEIVSTEPVETSGVSGETTNPVEENQ